MHNDAERESGEMLIIYLTFIVICVIGFAFIFSVIIYFLFSCWPLSTHGISPCLSKLHPLIQFTPIVLGAGTGTLLANRMTKEDE